MQAAVQAAFDFDLLCRLARDKPEAFEAQRHALLAAALEEVPAPHQAAARMALAQAQLRMAAAPNVAARLAVAFNAMGDSLQALQGAMAELRREVDAFAVTRTTAA